MLITANKSSPVSVGAKDVRDHKEIFPRLKTMGLGLRGLHEITSSGLKASTSSFKHALEIHASLLEIVLKTG